MNITEAGFYQTEEGVIIEIAIVSGQLVGVDVCDKTVLSYSADGKSWYGDGGGSYVGDLDIVEKYIGWVTMPIMPDGYDFVAVQHGTYYAFADEPEYINGLWHSANKLMLTSPITKGEFSGPDNLSLFAR